MAHELGETGSASQRRAVSWMGTGKEKCAHRAHTMLCKTPERDGPSLSEEGVLTDADVLAELGDERRCTLGIPYTKWVQRRGEM